MRMTKQKKTLHAALQDMKGVFSAEDFHQHVLKKNPKLGIATVYRFLGQQELHAYNCNRRTIYSQSAHSHCHFICEKCGKITHFHMKNADFLQQVPGEACHFQLEVTGTCKECK